MPLAARLAPAAVLLALLTLLAGCDATPGDGSPAEPEVVEQGTLVVCTELPYAPFVMREDGENTGFELDLLEEMAAGLDLDLEVRPTAFASLDNGRALRNERCDVAAGALLITPERRDRMAFVRPHYTVRLSLLVPAASDIDGLADLAGRRVAVQADTIAEAYARRNAPPDAAIDVLAGDQFMVDALGEGRVDAVLQDLPFNLAHIETGRFTVVEQYVTEERYAFAVRPESVQLRRSLTRELARLRDDGTYRELYDQYLTAD